MTIEWGANGHLTADHKSLEFTSWGPSPQEAPTIVLLHEGLGCTALWRDFPAKLARATGFGVFSYSRAGYGHSDQSELPRPLDYMTYEATNVLPDVLDQIGVSRCILFGHSDGATIAAIYAGSVVDHRVRGIVTMAPHFFTEDMGLAEIALAAKAFETSDLKRRMAKYHKDPVHTFRGWNDAWLHPEFKDWNVSEVIDYIRVPVLAIQGEQDQYGTLAQIEELKTRCYAPVDVTILDNCRHSPFLDQQDKVLDAVKLYCDRLERIEAAEVQPA